MNFAVEKPERHHLLKWHRVQHPIYTVPDKKCMISLMRKYQMNANEEHSMMSLTNTLQKSQNHNRSEKTEELLQTEE